MAKENQSVSILGVLILLVAVLFVFGLYGQNLTIGSAVKTNRVTTITVSPKIVAPGQKMTISIDPGTKGAYVEQGVDLYKVSPTGLETRKETIRSICEGYHVCYDDTPQKDSQAKLAVTIVASVGWDTGKYAVVTEDQGTGEKVKAYFTVAKAN